MHHIVLPSSRYVIHCVLTTLQDSTLTEERRGQSQHSYITNSVFLKTKICTVLEEKSQNQSQLQRTPIFKCHPYGVIYFGSVQVARNFEMTIFIIANSYCTIWPDAVFILETLVQVKCEVCGQAGWHIGLVCYIIKEFSCQRLKFQRFFFNCTRHAMHCFLQPLYLSRYLIYQNHQNH